MLVKSSVVALLLAILVFFLELETANITRVISKSPCPSYAVEGKNFTLEWIYTLDGTVGSTKFSIVTDDGSEVLIGKKFGPGVITVEPQYRARFRAEATDTRAELAISAVKTSDEQTYKLDVLPDGKGAISDKVILTVNSSSRITEITGKTVIEGGNVTLYCSAEGKPTPSITWTRLSDSRIVTMPLINMSRRDVRDYRCTAENGVGAPATRNITIDVQFAPESASLSTNLSTVPLVCFGMVVNFTCTVEASNPAVVTFTLYENGLVVSNKVDSGVWIKILDTGGKVTYECQANNSVGTSSSNKTVVSVEVSASATVESNNIVVREGKDVDLVCNGSGIPSPRIFWLNVSNVIMENGRIWSLHNISRAMAGQYTCIARNSCGNNSQKVDLVVLYPTEATGTGENATEALGGVKMFSCPVNGNPEPSITWYSEETGRTISSGRQLEAEKSGCYTCVARNTVGPAVSITQCLIIIPPSTMSPEPLFTSVPPSTVPPGGAVGGKVMIAKKYSDDYQNLDSGPSKEFVAWFSGEMDKIYVNLPEYYWTQVLNLRPGSVIVNFILHFRADVTREKGLENLRVAISSNGTFGGIEAEYLSNKSTTSTTPASPKLAVSVSAGPPWAIIGAVAGGVLLLAISVGVLIWWLYKERKCKKDTKIPNPDLGRQEEEGAYSLVQGAYAQSGPPAANGTDGAAAEQQLEGATAIPSYAVVDKSKKKKKLREVPPVYAEVDKSKKKKKKIDDKNLYETLGEPKKAKIPGELLYADLGDFQNRTVSTVSISPQPLPAIKKPEAYERTDYADIAQFLKGNTTSPQNGGNEDTEWKPERPSKKRIQGKDNETQI